MKNFIRFTLNHTILIIILTLVITIFMSYQALHVEMDTNVNNMLPNENKRINLIQEKLGIESEASNYLFLSIAGDNLFDLEVLGTFQDTIDTIMTIQGFEAVLSPFNFLFFETDGRRIVPGTISPTGRTPETTEELNVFEQRLKNQSLSDNFVVADDGRILNAMFLTNSSLEENKGLVSTFEKTIKPLEEITRVHYTGELPFRERVGYYLGKDFSILLALALAAILIIFWLSFRSIQAVILPVTVVIIGAIWSVGFMSLVGFPITIVSVIIPSLVLTIGSSYTIHVLSEYYRNTHEEGTDKKQWISEAVEHVVRTVIVASLTTMISFLSLLVTSLKPLQEFGLAISLGILFCAILALFFLPAVFSLIPIPRKKHSERIHKGFLIRGVSALGNWSSRHVYIIGIIFVLLFVGFILVYPAIRHQSDYFSYFPADDRIIKDTRFINEHSGGSQTFNITLTAPDGEEGYFLDTEVLKTVDTFETAIGAHPSVTYKLSFLGILKSMNKAVSGEESVPESRGLILLLNRYFQMIPTGKFILGQDSSIISEDGNSITIYLKMAEAETFNMMNEDDVKEFLTFAEEELEKYIGDSMESYFWGSTVLLLDLSRIFKQDQMRSTFLSMLLGILITAIVFRSFPFSLITTIPLLSGIFCYYLMLYVSNIPLDMTTIMVTNVIVGVGLDDAVHFILQYRHQRKSKEWKKALNTTLRITGKPIVLTTLSLVTGLLMLCFASFKPIVYFGYLVAGTLFSAMIGTIVFIPAAIVFMERFNERRSRRKGLKALTGEI